MTHVAVVLVIVAFFLKAAIVPFHAWAPDAYETAAVPVTAYMAVLVKAAVSARRGAPLRARERPGAAHGPHCAACR